MFEVKKVLVPIDFSDFSIHALKYGIFTAKNFGAKISILHVISQEFLSEIRSVQSFSGIGDSLDELLEKKKRDAKKSIEEIVEKEGDQSLFEGIHIRVGIPYEEIMSEAVEEGIDLIVIGTHGRSGLSHVFMGSVASKVVRRSPCPVLTVRAKSSDK